MSAVKLSMRSAVATLLWRADCPIPGELRAFIACLAQLANWRTGRGISGQQRIAAAMGCSVRSVRRWRALLTAMQIEHPESMTFVINWQARGDGAGRTSDAYGITVTKSGQAILLGGGVAASESEKEATAAAKQEQGSPLGELPVSMLGNENKIPPDPGDPAVASPGRGMGGAAAAPRRTELPAGWTPAPREAAMAAEWGRDLQEAAATFRAHAAASGRQARDWDAAFELWLLRGRKPRQEAAKRQEWQAARTAGKRAAAQAAFAAAIATAGGLGSRPANGMRSRLAADRQLLAAARRLLGVARGVALQPEHIAILVDICAGGAGGKDPQDATP